MTGADDLIQLAHLLRVGAGIVRDITVMRSTDAQMIESLAEQAAMIADRLDAIARNARDDAGHAAV